MTGNFNGKSITPRFELRDLGLIVGLTTLLPFAWLLPVHLWDSFSRLVATLAQAGRQISTRGLHQNIERAPGIDDPRAVEARIFANRIEQELEYLREYRPGGWQPTIRLAGIERIETAMRGGNGCILWIAPLFFSSLVAKKALHAAGVEVSFLSRSLHGPSNSEFGRRCINSIKIRREERYLHERIVMQTGTATAAARALRKRLRQGRVVAIAWAAYGDRLLDANLLDGIFPVAGGAPRIALAEGAPLLPIFTRRIDSNAFEIVVGEPIAPPERADRRDAIEHMLNAFCASLEVLALEDPAILTIWRHYDRGNESEAPNRT
ncbi:MAG: hypothetical protein ACR2QV_00075 [Gammaproteobacteria bacterium]